MLLLLRSNRSFFAILLKEGLVPVPVPQFPNLSFVPAGELREVAGNSGDSVYILGSAIGAGGLKAPARLVADVAGGEFGRESDLVILGQSKCFHHKISQG